MPHRALQEEERSLWTLFGTFFKIGLFTFGGGYAMIALLENEFITQKHWLGRDEFLD
ncbi:MAG: chromate transporter, partial [Faecalibacterium sp.]|nr:chromate transporter [Faecalibacterium sp.]